jgi:hypothetical protein
MCGVERTDASASERCRTFKQQASGVPRRRAQVTSRQSFRDFPSPDAMQDAGFGGRHPARLSCTTFATSSPVTIAFSRSSHALSACAFRSSISVRT